MYGMNVRRLQPQPLSLSCFVVRYNASVLLHILGRHTKRGLAGINRLNHAYVSQQPNGKFPELRPV